MADHSDVRRSHGYHPLRVEAVVQETPDTRSFVLGVPDEFADLYRYRAGQFCTFRVHVEGEELLRCYSMSSAPSGDAPLTVTVKRVPDGTVSSWLVDHVAVGDVLEATPPAGVFCASTDERPVLAFCGGSGVTPVMSIARDVLATTDRPVTILYANRDADSVIFRDALDELASSHPGRLRVDHHLDVESGFVTAQTVADLAERTGDADVLICGPTPFMDLVESTLLETGIPQDRIAIERFVNDNVVGGAASGEATVAAGDDESGIPTEVEIQLDGKKTTIAYQPGETILQTARRGGLAPPFSCEAGNCATCMALLHEGSATMRANTALTDDEVAEGWVLTCQALPEGDVVRVEYESF